MPGFFSKKSTPKKEKVPAGSLDLQHLAQLGEDDRIAVMQMVKEGELSVGEAVQKVLASASARASGNKGMKRQGAVKRAFRGRLKLKAMAVGPDKPISILLVTVEACRDLEPEMCDAFVELSLQNSADSGTVQSILVSKLYFFGWQFPHTYPLAKPAYVQALVVVRLGATLHSLAHFARCCWLSSLLLAFLLCFADGKATKEKSTPIRPKTKHPIFNEKFQWEIRKSEYELESWRLHINVMENQKGLVGSKKIFLGSFSFALAEVRWPSCIFWFLSPCLQTFRTYRCSAHLWRAFF